MIGLATMPLSVTEMALGTRICNCCPLGRAQARRGFPLVEGSVGSDCRAIPKNRWRMSSELILTARKLGRRILVLHGPHDGIGGARRTKMVRLFGSKLRFRHRRLVALGETNSGFYRAGWETVDLLDADFICDLRKERLPFGRDSVDAIYSSHLIEHLSYESGLLQLRDTYRCLKPGGYLRIVTPDMDLLLDRYRANDWAFFLRADGRFILDRICAGSLLPECLLIHNRLVGWFASYSGRLDTGGGPVVKRHVVDRQLRRLPKYEFRNWCVSLLEPERIYSHIHLYDYRELRRALEEAGFRDVQRMSWGESASKVMLNPPIDRARHQSYSLYVEAVK
jgi:predicted SAM-dependent methyltransferase